MGKFYSQKVFSKEDCKIVENLTKEEIQNLGKEERVFFKCSQCGKEVIQRAACFKKSFLELCRACKMEKRLGYRNNFNAPDFLEKRQKAFEKKYGSYEKGYKACREKAEKTNLEKYGCIAPLQNKKVLEKFLKTNNERYGANSPSQNEAIKQKQIETSLRNWGFRSSAQNEIVKEKAKQTCLKHFGVENGFLTKNCFESHSRCKYEFDDQRFDSSWELILWVYAKDHNEEIEREPEKLEFEFEGKLHFYFPDFRYKGNLIEIKGPHFFEDGKMICPFDRSKDGLSQAKYECMLKNNIKIFSSKEIRVFKDYVIKTYGKQFIKGCMTKRVSQTVLHLK